MKRKIYDELVKWKRESADRYALLVEGARRVGKSWIVREFAKNEYETHLLIDFARVNSQIKNLFEEKLDNLDEFFMLLEARTRVKLVPRKTLIVFDEVQRFPRAREAVKYLVEDGRFHYIETGSLISIKKNVENIVIPSEEMKVQMYPMDFEEFLWALGADGVMQLIRKRFVDRVPMGQQDHRMVMELFRQYLVIGGMPQAVEAFSRGRDLASAEKVKRVILGLYQDDIGKFAGRYKQKVRAIWSNIPGALSAQEKRFRPAYVGEGVRMRELDSPFEWLAESMTVNLASNVTDPNAGLRLTEDRTAIKCYMADTGLLVSHSFSENRHATYDMHRNQEDAASRMEIEFLLAKSHVTARHNIYPIEVKSANDYTTASMDKFVSKFSNVVAQPIVVHPGDADFSGAVLRLPLYMAMLIPELTS